MKEKVEGQQGEEELEGEEKIGPEALISRFVVKEPD